jgi:cellulose synthase/poly-beta-1,6-N-acetylglucosamine synthase-like glycosyltransferase
MVGPVTSWAAGPQRVAVDYRSPDELDAFAARRRRGHAGQALEVERLIGFCLLIRREVLAAIGGNLDERFGLGFFEDDDLCIRAREKGFRLAVARDVFVHHYGNRTFVGLGLDTRGLLQENFERFREKWGTERTAGYRLPDAISAQPSAVSEEATLARSVSEGECRPSLTLRASVARPLVSLTMIVRNGEAGLGACLDSVGDLVDEMVVVDTGSTDRTKEIALEHGARVVDFTWEDSFAAARNESLRHATGKWILWLDADERLDETNRQRLRTLLGSLGDENVAYMMRQSSPLEASTHATAHVDQVRLFPNHPQVRWQYRVHEQILISLRQQGAQVRTSDIVIAPLPWLKKTLARFSRYQKKSLHPVRQSGNMK